MTQPPGPGWSDPKAAFAEYRPGLSAYLHYFHDLRASRDEKVRQPDLDPDAGAGLPFQIREALQKLIDESFE